MTDRALIVVTDDGSRFCVGGIYFQDQAYLILGDTSCGKSLSELTKNMVGALEANFHFDLAISMAVYDGRFARIPSGSRTGARSCCAAPYKVDVVPWTLDELAVAAEGANAEIARILESPVVQRCLDFHERDSSSLVCIHRVIAGLAVGRMMGLDGSGEQQVRSAN